ncbi:MAG: TIGR01777 family oxidoreductase [Chromatiales bacterium]|nr:TIGR01777 family oxidoreductase [Chromatiales bacterium]
MKIAISGATGFIGSHLTARFEKQGEQVIKLTRSDFKAGVKHLISHLENCAVIINLAGEPLNRRWSPSYMQAIYNSRIETTRLLVAAVKEMGSRPRTLISTSAIGAFTSSGRYTEHDTPNASDFLGNITREWEQEAQKAADLGVRTLIFRFALVLGCEGGLIKQVLPPFRMGLGGTIGDGSQPFSWVHIDDLTRAYEFALAHPEMEGIYHICAPNPVTNRIFTKTLGQLLHRPTLLPVPVTFLQLAFGKGAEAITSGQCVVSERLPQAGFVFEFDTIDKALQEIIAETPQKQKPSKSKETNVK